MLTRCELSLLAAGHLLNALRLAALARLVALVRAVVTLARLVALVRAVVTLAGLVALVRAVTGLVRSVA